MTIDKDSPDKFFPLRYEDGPDYCTVKDARGKDFALTVQPDVLKEMEIALRVALVNSISHSRSSAGNGVVNGLGWMQTEADRGDGSSEFSGFEAETPFGTFYAIEIHGDAFTVEYDLTKIGEADTADEAKRIGQRDFERRIRMALRPTEPQPTQVTADQAAEDVRREREAKAERDRYAKMTTAEKCAVQGDGFINDYD